jgi:hypothetical protein
MISSAERRRLEAAYPTPADAGRVLQRCAIGLLAVFIIAMTAGILGDSPNSLMARVSAPPAATGH